MELVNSKKIILALLTSTVLCTSLGCVRTDGSSAYTETTAGKNWVKNEAVVRHKTPNGRVILDTQSTYEKFKCIGKNGATIKAALPEECIRKGGKVYEETVIEETTQRGR